MAGRAQKPDTTAARATEQDTAAREVRAAEAHEAAEQGTDRDVAAMRANEASELKPSQEGAVDGQVQRETGEDQTADAADQERQAETADEEAQASRAVKDRAAEQTAEGDEEPDVASDSGYNANSETGKPLRGHVGEATVQEASAEESAWAPGFSHGMPAQWSRE